jgi:thiol-disulfide isomerase/thioredoxin
MSKLKIVLAVLLAMAALAGGVFTQIWLKTASVQETTPVLDVAFPDFDGKPHFLNEWKGKILIVNFWASWCAPCVEEIPAFFLLQSQLQDKGVQFIGILVDDELDIAQAFLKPLAPNYPMLNGNIGGRQWAAKLGNHAEVLPYSLVIDANGKLVHTEIGTFSRDEVLEQIKPLLR